MKQIIGTRVSGKTTKMVRDAIENKSRNRIIFVTSYPDYIRGLVDGLTSLDKNNVEVISYAEFIKKIDTMSRGYTSIYIDEIDGFLKSLCGNDIKGYTLSLENFMGENNETR